MPPSSQPRIFLSYGHDEYASLALRIKRDLEAQGNEVWFDLERLKTGGDWERYIEDGLDFASAVPELGRFLLLMTPHSVRRPDGYCLNELARALTRNLPVIPVMVVQVEPPLSIGRLQYLDMRQCFPADQHEEQYKRLLDQLLAALVQKQVPYEGVQQRLLNYLDPVSYGDDLNRHLARFTGRDWVMAEVDDWLRSSRRFLWITGDAGVGKSALAAWLCVKRPEIDAYHFCRFGNNDRVDARRALFSLAYQFSTQLSDYRDRLNASSLDKIAVETNAPALFERLFVEPLEDLVPPNPPRVLLIDALDEASQNGKNELASIIGSRFDRLPGWLRLIATSRPYEEDVNFALQSLDPWKLDAGRSENLDDIRKYLNRELQPFSKNGPPSDKVIDTIVERSEGLFLYVSWVRQELQDGRLSLDRVEFFPRGLGGVYKEFFERYFPDIAKYQADCRPALEAICAAREPLEPDDFRAMFGWSEYEMDGLAGQLGSLFPVRDGRLRPFHQSVRDWLSDRQRSGPYRVDIKAGEERLADFGWRQYKQGVRTMRRYCRLHSAAHLAACDRQPELRELLLNPDWISAKLKDSNVVSLLSDYDLSPESREQAASKTPGDSNIDPLQLVHGALRLSSNAIARDSGQLPSQMMGRLLPYQDTPTLANFMQKVAQGTENRWLRSLHPALHPPGTALVRTLEGHRARLQCVTISRDGRIAVSSDEKGSLKLWEVESGRELRTLQAHPDSVEAVALSADGRIAVSASDDKTLRVWDVASGALLHTLTGHSHFIRSVCLSDDGKIGLSGSVDDTLRIWDIKNGRLLRTVPKHTEAVYAIALTADGQTALSTLGSSETLNLWDVTSGRVLRKLAGTYRSVNAVALSRDGHIAIAACRGKNDKYELKVWDAGTGRELRDILTGTDEHSGVIWKFALSADGKFVAAPIGTALKLWRVETGVEAVALHGHSDSVESVALSEDGSLALSASADRTLKVWDVKNGRTFPGLERHTGPVNGVAVSVDGRTAISGADDGMLKVWEVESGREIRTIDCSCDEIHDAALSGDARLAAVSTKISGEEESLADVRNLKTGKSAGSLKSNFVSRFGVSLSRKGDILGAPAGQVVRLWKLPGGSELQFIQAHDAYVTGVALSADGRLVLSVSYDHTLKLWNVKTGRNVRTMEAPTRIVGGALSADARRAIAIGDDNSLTLWDAKTGTFLRTLVGHSDEVSRVALTETGSRAVSTSTDCNVILWDLENGTALATFTCDGAPTSCAFIDECNIVAGDAGGHVHFLRLEEPQPRK